MQVLKEFLSRECSVEMALFLDDIRQFKAHVVRRVRALASGTARQRKRDRRALQKSGAPFSVLVQLADQLYNTYVRPDAPCEVCPHPPCDERNGADASLLQLNLPFSVARPLVDTMKLLKEEVCALRACCAPKRA